MAMGDPPSPSPAPAADPGPVDDVIMEDANTTLDATLDGDAETTTVDPRSEVRLAPIHRFAR